MTSGKEATEESIQTGVLMLPWPPSVNTYWRNFRGRMLVSKEGREYRTAVAEQVVAQAAPKFREKPLKLNICAYRPDKRRRDLDNLLKAALDAMCSAGVFDDDSQVVDLRIFWGPHIGGYLMVEMEEVNGRAEPA